MNTRDKLRIIAAANERNRRRVADYISKQMQAKASNSKQTKSAAIHGNNRKTEGEKKCSSKQH